MERMMGKTRGGSAMQRFSHGGPALLPFTRQIFSFLWTNVLSVLQVIFCTLMAVFQMFRFEVHLRITDDTGEHIQHVTNGHGDTEGFLLSSLFESNKNVVVEGPSPLSRFNKEGYKFKSHSRSVLSSLVNEDLCCSLVDELVSCAGDGLGEDACAGEQVAWKHRFDWNFLTGLETRTDEERVPNQFQQSDWYTGLELNLSRLKVKSQSSDSDFSWGSSDISSADREREDSDGLWDLLSYSNDPYHPLHFTACVSSAATNPPRIQTGLEHKREFIVTQSSVSSCSDSSTQESREEEEDQEEEDQEDKEEALWKSLSLDDDPYHPLNFRGPLNSAHTFTRCPMKNPTTSRGFTSSTCPKLLQRRVLHHRCPQLGLEKPVQVPWKKSINKTVDASKGDRNSTGKKVKFSPIVQVHKMRVWSFAHQACRKGPWEERARDRDRFQRRILETEQAIGYCFMESHREKFRNHHY